MKKLTVRALVLLAGLVISLLVVDLLWTGPRMDRAEQRFDTLFHQWWASETACMSEAEQWDAISSISPRTARIIEGYNARFEQFALREANGSLTVAERNDYLMQLVRVPHLVRTGEEWYDWAEADPTGILYENAGPLIRPCPTEQHSHGGHIHACFGYVNYDLHEISGRLRSDGTPRTIFSSMVLDTLREGQPLTLSGVLSPFLGKPTVLENFVSEMEEDLRRQASRRRQAEQIVANLPASEVSAGFEEWRVRAEYERLRCSQ